jgi:triosephosphate isomerase
MQGSPTSSSVCRACSRSWRRSLILRTHRIGHSERRTLFGETSTIVAGKTRAALDAGLRIILCVGETLAEREAGRTQQVVEEQLQTVVALLSPEDWRFVA